MTKFKDKLIEKVLDMARELKNLELNLKESATKQKQILKELNKK